MAKLESIAGKVTPVTVGELLETMGKAWDLSVIEGERWLNRKIETFELSRPGLALAGYYEVFSVERAQVMGITEITFLRSLTPRERLKRLRRMLEFPIPCVIVTTSLEPPPELVKVMREHKLPLLRTSHSSTPFQAELGQFLERRLAQRYIVHGVMVEVFGLGVMIQGKSGVGKSESGLELVERGHLLIADDIVLVRRVSRGRIFCEASPNLGYHMEIRGIGIIDVERLFGVRSVREEAELGLIVKLEKWDPKKDYERLGLTEKFESLLDCDVPQVVIPVEPGRNLAQIIEVAALMQRLRNQGVNLAEDFSRRIMATIERKRADLSDGARYRGTKSRKTKEKREDPAAGI